MADRGVPSMTEGPELRRDNGAQKYEILWRNRGNKPERSSLGNHVKKSKPIKGPEWFVLDTHSNWCVLDDKAVE